MSLGRGFFGGLMGAAAGGAGWAAISMATDMRLGFLAIAVGGLAGFGMGVGNKARGGIGAGVLAALAAAVGILGSRYVVTHFGVQALLRGGAGVTEDIAVTEVASDIYTEWTGAGYELEFEADDEYPAAVVEEAKRRWSRLTPEEQSAYLVALAAHYHEQGQEFAGTMTAIAFLIDFGLFGFMWVGFGVATAFKIGCTRGDGSASGAAGGEEPTAAFWARTASTKKEAADDELPADPLAALGAGMRAELASDKSGQFRSVPSRVSADEDTSNLASGVLGAAMRDSAAAARESAQREAA